MLEWLLSPPAPHPRARLAAGLWAIALYVLIAWTWWTGLFGRGAWPTQLGDWPKECLYHLVLRDSVQRSVVPLRIGPADYFGGLYIGIPETPIGPWNFLLASLFADSRYYVVACTMLMCAAGYAGLVLMWKRYRLSPLAFTTMALLFSLNGHIVAHMMPGHTMWTGYFLLPWLFLAIPDLLERRSTIASAHAGLILSLMLFQGAFHIVVVTSVFLLCLSIGAWRRLKPIVFSLAFVALFGAVRVLPCLATFANLNRPDQAAHGFPSLDAMLEALTTLRDGFYGAGSASIYEAWGWHEMDCYVSIIGLLFIVIYGVIIPIVRWAALAQSARSILGASLIVLLWSMGDLHRWIASLIPIARGEQVPTRFLIVPLVAVLFVAGTVFQRDADTRGWARNKPIAVTLAACVGLLYVALRSHAVLWSIPDHAQQANVLEDCVWPTSGAVGLVPVDENKYVLSVRVGAVVSAISITSYVGLILRRWAVLRRAASEV